ncbi:hypothetical protein PHLCEN_2v13382 [Hermanssonia centrifuga]|uniref:PAS domain-containing protein n=1 Tax=Hermanssonia centrifuga TaxID=98765 RepID=A0A2R6NFI7_9APHY|nr:hypothetical protein PHLCEN_2v13382 [Hermanssonia centrifuga]
MTCSFTVVDTRRFDHPIVYASPSFCKLTGYSELEVIGKNCRFLQSPNGLIQKGEQRRHTAPDAVAHLRKSLVADKECQVSLINYRKNNSAFINLVTVIPIHGGAHNSPDEADEVVYHVGFQVDLTEQPNAILQRLRDGTYMVNYSNNVAYPAASTSKDWKANSAAMIGVSKQFRASLSDLDFINSIPLHISTTALSLNSSERNEKSDPYDGNRLLSLLLLEASPDFVHVLSLKGTFLYVAPSVQRVLGYQPEDLVGKSITDFCHTADTVPLMRELKESSSPGTVASPNTEDQSPLPSAAPRVVDLLFRMRSRSGAFLWLECRGRLHVEPGKGRKAIILSGRTRNMPSLEWGPIARAGGFTPSIRRPPSQMTSLSNGKSTSRPKDQEREVWGLLSTTGSFLFIGTAVRDVLGWGAGEVMGRAISDFVGGQDPQHARSIFEETLGLAFTDDRLEARSLSCEMKRKDGSHVPVEVFFYHPTDRDASSTAQSLYPQRISERPLVCQIKVSNCSFDLTASMPLPSEHAHSVFEELDTSRGSSWQYELQQLKYANQRLTEELEELEASNEAPPPATSSREAVHTRHSFDASTPWAHHLQGMGHQVQLPLKRSWDGTVIGGGPT